MDADTIYWKLTEHLEQLNEFMEDFLDLVMDPNEALFRFERATCWLDEFEEFHADLENFLLIYVAEKWGPKLPELRK